VNLFVFGLGYTASHFVRNYRAAFDRVAGTVRSLRKDGTWDQPDTTLFRFDGEHVDPGLEDALQGSDAVLVSVQPGIGDDPVLGRFGPAIEAARHIRRVVYLSTIGVYGDHGGAWIDEAAPTRPDNARQGARVDTEQAWLALAARSGKAMHVLRLAGIYGPGRNVLRDLQAGEARRIDKPGQVFNRIHVADIGAAIAAALQRDAQEVVNVTDDEPAPASDVVAYAAALMGIEPPPMIPFETATLSPMARTFYGANRRVGNAALKRNLGVRLRYPTFRVGLDALWAEGEGRS
jgi:nucleoside-diphosphate-sugar epimerase